MTTIFVIGPSNVGKSTQATKMAAEDGFAVIKSDDSVKARHGSPSAYLSQVGNKQFFEETVRCVQEDLASGGTDNVLVDIGAGALQYAMEDFEAVAAWIKSAKSILIIDSPEQIVKRDHKLKRSLEEYKRSEFTQVRERLYEIATSRLEVNGREPDEIFPDFRALVFALCGIENRSIETGKKSPNDEPSNSRERAQDGQ